MAVEPETPGLHGESEAESSSTALVSYNPPLNIENNQNILDKNEEAPQPTEENTCRELTLYVPERKYRKKNWEALKMRTPTLRPRKKVSEPDLKKSQKKGVKGKSRLALVSGLDQMLPPELPLAITFPVLAIGSSTTEMPLLHSETSSSNSSEASSSSRRRKNARATPRKKKGQDQSNERGGVPSPTLADVNVNAACPESSATVDGAMNPALCQCVEKTQVYVSSNHNNMGELTCQALDSLDGRVIGCSHTLPSSINGLHRPSLRTSLIMLCSVHYQRLLRHICCPGCGLYCTQGKFLTCRSSHYYHKECRREEGCPHCGDTSSPKTVTLSMKSHGNPVFLPKPRVFRKSKPAKMSLSKRQHVETESRIFIKLPPEVEQWNAKSHPPEAEKLGQYLDVLCSPLPAAPFTGSHRYSHKDLLNAVQLGDAVKMLRMLCSGLNPNYAFADLNQQTTLHVAASLGHVTLVHLLLQAGLCVDMLDGDQHSPLSLAVKEGHLDVIHYLVKAGASLILKVNDGMTPLHLAAKKGVVEACNILLAAPNLPRRYVDSLDDGGWTPLVWAAEYNHTEVVRYLLKEGGDPLLRDNEQNIALHWAAYGGCLDVVELLLSSGSEISAVNVDGDTPLHIASRERKFNCVLLLLARGAQCDIKNNLGHTPRNCSDKDSNVFSALSINEKFTELISGLKYRGPKILSNDISRGKERHPVQCVNAVDDAPEPKDFVYVNEYCFTSGVNIDRTIKNFHTCGCQDKCTSGGCTCTSISLRAWYDSESKLTQEFTYNDPPMIFECNQLCNCNQILCQNRVVQRGLFCRFQLFRTETRGWGLKTLETIPRGTYVCEYVGEIITDSEADKRKDDSYLFDLDNRDGDTFCVDARKYGNMSRFINHMCSPNLTPVKVFCEHQDLRFPKMAFFANQDIPANSELGYNYGEKFWVVKWKTFTCICGSEKCIYSETTIKSTLGQYNKKMKDLKLMDTS